MNRRDLLKGLGLSVGASSLTGCGAGNFAGASRGNVMARPELLDGIDTFVVLMMENRSFDHFLGARKLVMGSAIEGLTGDESNPDASGNRVKVYEQSDYTVDDPPHSWEDAHAQWNGGANDGFVRLGGAGTMGFHTRDQLPVTWALADEFAICDRWHSSVMGPTFPNRYFLHGATSRGLQANEPLPGFTSIFDLLADAGIKGRTYYHDIAFQTAYFRFEGLTGVENFFADAAQGTLPALSIIDPKLTGPDANDDHPDSDVRLGEALIASVYAALAASPQWGRCMLLVTFDEHGGFYDHVAPGTTQDGREPFRQLGFRVPTIVAGPTIAKGSIVSTPFEHVSVISTVSRRFGLPSLNERVECAADLSACVDASLVAAPRSAPKLPAIQISRAELRARLERGVIERAHPELQDLHDQGDVPRSLDRRGDRDITPRLLEAGAKLGAVTLAD